MTTVVQTVGIAAWAGVASKTFTLAATGAGHLGVITLCIEGGTGAYTGVSVTDNGSGDVWTVRKSRAGANLKSQFVVDCLNLSAGVTSVTVTPTGGAGGVYGSGAVQEVSGTGVWSADQSGSGAESAGTCTVTASAVDVGTSDFVTASIGIGSNNVATGITNPPTGYTTSVVNQNDSADSAGECCYRINASALTDAVTWSATTFSTNDGGILQSYKVAAADILLGQILT